jgi:hypothetical protein
MQRANRSVGAPIVRQQIGRHSGPSFEREPRLLSDEVYEFAWCRVLTVPKAIVHIRVFN